MTQEVQAARWAWPQLEVELAVGVTRGQPSLTFFRPRGQKPLTLLLTPEQCDMMSDALETVADVSTGVVRSVEFDMSPLLK